MSKMIVMVVGATRGSFKDEDSGSLREYASAYVLEDLKTNKERGTESVGSRADKYTCTKEAFEGIAGAKLPADFICEIETSQGQNGARIKLLTAKALGGGAKVQP